jgi:hypothetical protein
MLVQMMSLSQADGHQLGNKSALSFLHAPYLASWKTYGNILEVEFSMSLDLLVKIS